MKVHLQKDAVRPLKRHLRRALPGATATERVEAVARGLRHNSYASLLASLSVTQAIQVEFDEPAFVSYLVSRRVEVPPRTLQRVVIRTILDNILEKHRNLTMHGFGAPHDQYPGKEYGVEVERSRAEFFENKSCDEFELALLLLKCVERRKTLNRDVSSYRLKHIAENLSREFGIRRGLGNYVSNGAFIAAAIHQGFEVRRVAWNSLNGYLNVSMKSVKALGDKEQAHNLLLDQRLVA